MGEVYKMNIAGCERALPICPIDEHMDIAGFVMFSDVEITKAAAAELLHYNLHVYVADAARGDVRAAVRGGADDKADLHARDV